MSAELIRILTEKGPVTVNKNVIVSIDPHEKGTKIVLENNVPSQPQTYISIEDYHQVVLHFLSA